MRFFINSKKENPLILVKMDLAIDENGVQIEEEVPEGYNNLMDITTIEILRESYLGKYFGMRDWYSLRSELKKRIQLISKEDYSNFDGLIPYEKEIALNYLPTKIISFKGFNFFVEACGSVDEANKIIVNYLEVSTISRTKRYEAFVSYAYGKLGALEGLQAERYVREKDLNTQWQSRGVSRKSIDGIDGIVDWLLGETGTIFEGNGLKQNIEAEVYTIKDGTPVDEFIGNCILIIENGFY